MKTIRNVTTLAGVSLMLFALCAPSAKAQALSPTNLGGTFTLPFEAQWGPMTLPAGEYSLYYGLTGAGTRVVEVIGKAKGSPHGFIGVQKYNLTSTTKTVLICVRWGDSRIVRELDMAEIGESLFFGPPRGAKPVASQRNHNVYAQLGEVPMLIQRIPVTLNGR